MLNEKKIMADKVIALSFLAICAGSSISTGCLFVLLSITKMTSGGLGILGVLFILISVILGVFADKVQKQIRDYIKQPYLEEVDEEGPPKLPDNIKIT